MQQKYSWWKPKYYLFKQGVLYYSKSPGIEKDQYKFDVCNVRLLKITDADEVLEAGIATKITCRKDGFLTHFRCIVPVSMIDDFAGAFSRVSADNNIEEFMKSITEERAKAIEKGETSNALNTSPFRKNVRSMLNSVEKHSTKDLIIAR